MHPAICIHGAETGNAGAFNLVNVLWFIDQYNAAAVAAVLSKRVVDQGLLAGSRIDDFVQFTVCEKNKLDRKITGRMVFYLPYEVQEYPGSTYQGTICLCCPTRRETPACISLKNAALLLQMGEQGLDNFFFARVKAKKLLFAETGI